MSQKKWLYPLILCIALLTACRNDTSMEIYTYLEQAVSLEEPFQRTQEPLQQAEEKEYKLYEEIISLGLEDFDKIVSIADDALKSIEERQEMIDIEKNSIEISFDEFKKIEPEIVGMDEESKQILEKLNQTMVDRYERYQELYNVYSQTIKEDQLLFSLLKDKDLEIDILQEQINKVNQQYEDVLAAKEAFNTKTEEYNKIKKSFYESAGLEVDYK